MLIYMNFTADYSSFSKPSQIHYFLIASLLNILGYVTSILVSLRLIIFESKKTFDSKGQTIEETNYTKDGGVKDIHKTKYNSEGDEIEDERE